MILTFVVLGYPTEPWRHKTQLGNADLGERFQTIPSFKKKNQCLPGSLSSLSEQRAQALLHLGLLPFPWTVQNPQDAKHSFIGRKGHGSCIFQGTMWCWRWNQVFHMRRIKYSIQICKMIFSFYACVPSDRKYNCKGWEITLKEICCIYGCYRIPLVIQEHEFP